MTDVQILMVLHSHDCGKMDIDITIVKKHHDGSHNPIYHLTPNQQYRTALLSTT